MIRKRIFQIISAGMVMCLMTVSCLDEGKLYSHYEDVADSEWDKADTLSFDLPRIEARDEYHMTIMARTTDRYKYQNLNLKVEVYGETLVRTDTMSLQIFDKEGHNIGKGLVYAEVSKSLEHIELDTTEYTVKVINMMTETPLEGVSGIGLSLQH